MIEPKRALKSASKGSKSVAAVDLTQLRIRVESFLEHYCDYPLVDKDFLDVASGQTGEERLISLLEKAGYENRWDEYAQELVNKLLSSSGENPVPIIIGGVRVPYHLLLWVLEMLLPGYGHKNVKDVKQLERLTNRTVPAEDRDQMQEVLDTYPVRLSWHTIRQMRLSKGISHQYHPFIEELDPRGEVHTWVGQFHRGIVEQMYQNRVIFIMNMSCPVYCRFCFRKHKECRTQRAPKKEHVKQAVAYIREAQDVKEIVLTGGDPFMNKATLRYAISELAKIEHIQTLRLASRGVSYYPHLFLRDDSFWLNYLVRMGLELNQKGKRLELATHFLHPDEVSVDALYVISHLVKNGIPVYVQTPYVKGCNETGEPLVPLYNQLRAAGAEIHYIFMPTSPIQGNSVYWESISEGLKAARYLRAHLSDRAMPHITTATEIGKVDWNTSGWAVERSEDDPKYIWIRTPYTHAYYDVFAPIIQFAQTVRENAEGTLDAMFRCDIGDEDLFTGPRALSSSTIAFQYKLERTETTVQDSLSILQGMILADQRLLDISITPQPTPALVRAHKARVELDVGAPDDQLEVAYTYIEDHPEITDVVLSRKHDGLSGFSQTLDIVDRLKKIYHIVAIRLRTLKFNYQPQAFTRGAISRLASRNRITVVRPVRIEIETGFLHSSEFRPEHKTLVKELRQHGIVVYNNTPLLSFINDNEEEMLRISYNCRELGIEFTNVYVCGLPIQDEWNIENPIPLNQVIDIATYVRRLGSGREVPRYLLRTMLGEVDYSVVPRVFEKKDETITVTLRPHDLEFYKSLDPAFEWPEGIEIDDEGHPKVPVVGLEMGVNDFLNPENLG